MNYEHRVRFKLLVVHCLTSMMDLGNMRVILSLVHSITKKVLLSFLVVEGDQC